MGAEEWVLVSFVLFIHVLVYYKIPAKIAEALDNRAAKIKAELDEARRLKEDAQAILADYQRKRQEAEKEAEEIVAQARRETELMAEETRKSLSEMVERRTKLAEDKISRAEEQALDEVRTRAVDVAIGAARDLLAEKTKGGTSATLIEKSIEDLRAKFN